MGSMGIFPFKQTPQFSLNWTGDCNMVIGLRGDVNKWHQKCCRKGTVSVKILKQRSLCICRGQGATCFSGGNILCVTLPRTKPGATCSQFYLTELPAFQELPSKDFLSAIFYIQSPWFSCPERRTLHGEHPLSPTPLFMTCFWQEMNGIALNQPRNFC